MIGISVLGWTAIGAVAWLLSLVLIVAFFMGADERRQR
jgi:hypothetical protein